MKILLLLAVALCAAACAPMTAAERADREYERVDFRQRFIEDRARCNAAGGRIVILANGGQVDRHGVPLSRAYYRCS